MSDYYQTLGDDFSKDEIKSHFTPHDVQDKVKYLSTVVEDTLNNQCFMREVIFILLAKGGLRFGFDLLSQLTIPYYYDIAIVESYGDDTKSSGKIDIKHFEPNPEFYRDKAVVVIDDICDTGSTLRAMTKYVKHLCPEVFKILTCTLIWRFSSKPKFTPNIHVITAKHDDFFVGYGLGYGESCRHLRGIISIER